MDINCKIIIVDKTSSENFNLSSNISEIQSLIKTKMNKLCPNCNAVYTPLARLLIKASRISSNSYS